MANTSIQTTRKMKLCQLNYNWLSSVYPSLSLIFPCIQTDLKDSYIIKSQLLPVSILSFAKLWSFKKIADYLFSSVGFKHHSSYSALELTSTGYPCLQLLNPRMDIQTHHGLLSAIRLLITEDQCGGRFVFNHQILRPTKPSIAPPAAAAVGSRTESGPGGDNSKSQLQTLLTRAGYAAPTYKTKQLKNGQFRATVEFNGMQIMGQPCNNKKQAEKDAAAEALEWLTGRTQTGCDYIERMSMMLKKSKKDHCWTWRCAL